MELDYRTRSMHEAAYLTAMGADLSGIEGERYHSYFVFDDPDGDVRWLALELFVSDPNNAMVSAPKLFRALQKLKFELNRHLDDGKRGARVDNKTR